MAYISRPVRQLGDISDLDILREAIPRNAERNITGFLLRGPDLFCQVLEGAQTDTMQILELIRGDKRHFGMRASAPLFVRDRQFGDWAMGYADVSPDEAARLGGMSPEDDASARALIDMVYGIALRHAARNPDAPA